MLRLYDTIDKLNVRDRTIYVLRFIEGLEQAEISDAIGLSVSTVRRRLERLTRRVNSLMIADPVLSHYVSRGRGATPSGDSSPALPACRPAGHPVAGLAAGRRTAASATTLPGGEGASQWRGGRVGRHW